MDMGSGSPGFSPSPGSYTYGVKPGEGANKEDLGRRKRRMPSGTKKGPPLEVQAHTRRTNDKVRQKPRKGIIEDTGGGVA